MGQSQSSNGAANRGDHGEETDLYKILGVEANASADEIKKAYKRKALELHPDRNYGDAESSTALFAQVQSAYDVLSDPQERAWYDSHRDSFLFDGNWSDRKESFGSAKVTTADDVMRYFVKFGPQVQFSDASSGFFGGLRQIFDQLAEEETLACKWDGTEPFDYPSFGCKDDDHVTVRGFYSIWNNFSTKKSFSWKDVYRYSEAPDRRTRRLMEKENKRLRDEAIREFNDAVRSLVAFVKRRDPRYKATAQSEAERQRTLREAAATQAARSRAANESKLQGFTLPDWARTEDQEDDELTSETEPEQQYFRCEICRKYFKSMNQFEAHEQSKKHIKAVKQVQWKMQNEDREFQLNAAQSGAISTPSDRYSNAASHTDGAFIGTAEIDQSPPQGSVTQPNAGTEPSHSVASISGNFGPGDEQTDHMPTNTSDSQSNASCQDPDTEDLVDGVTQQLSDTAVADKLPAKAPGKAKQKRAKKAAQRATEGQSKMVCSYCHAAFASRTKLFNHIKELGHAQLSMKDQSRKKTNKKGATV